MRSGESQSPSHQATIVSGVDPRVFTGEYRHTVDDKGRIAVPVKFRAQLDPGSMVSGWLDDCLAIHTKAGWDDAVGQGRGAADHRSDSPSLPAFDLRRTRSRPRWTPGPVLLPAYLRESVGLGGEAVIVGSRDHAEIWAPDRWDAYRRALDDPQELAQAFEGLGI